jgi:hypothetical protein
MHRISTAILLTALVGLVVGLTSLQSDRPESLTDDPHANLINQDQRTFEGAARCKTCHRKEEDGEQFGIWEASAHAKAFATLASDEAKAVAAEKGIENPQEADECLKCHVTAHGVAEEFLGKRFDKADGVGCESCHGAGGDYYKKATMEGIASGEIDPASVGLLVPSEETCIQCHNEESPTYKEFDYETFFAKIAHPIPEG